MKMYGFWRSQATFRVRVALNLKGIAYEEIPVNLDAGPQNEAFRRINPLGSVPALIVDDHVLSQSTAILEYLEEMHPRPPLLPADPLGRARVRSLAAIAISDSHPLIVPRVKRRLAEDTAGFDAARWKAWQTHWFTTGLKGLEARLAGETATGAFCHGDSVTFADICLVGLLAGATTFGIAVGAIPTVERIVRRCEALPAFVAAEASRQADYPGQR